MKTFKKIVFWIFVSFAIIQFIPIDKTNKPVDKSVNFIDVKKSPPKVVALLKNACYDCHSNEDHINEGREHLNFSVWNTYNKELKECMLSKSIQTLQDKSMPMPAYVVYHKEANLSDAERTVLIKYFEEILKSKSY